MHLVIGENVLASSFSPQRLQRKEAHFHLIFIYICGMNDQLWYCDVNKNKNREFMIQIKIIINRLLVFLLVHFVKRRDKNWKESTMAIFCCYFSSSLSSSNIILHSGKWTSKYVCKLGSCVRTDIMITRTSI